MKKKYRIFELANGCYRIEYKYIGFWGILDGWNYWGTETNLKDAITYCEECIVEDKKKYGPRKLIKIIKP